MSWFLLGSLVYSLVGTILVVRFMRGMVVKASISEWLAIILLWPLAIRFFAHLSMVQCMIRDLERLPGTMDKDAQKPLNRETP
jgi:hypothetical protein